MPISPFAVHTAIGTGLGAGLGALEAEKGHRWQGAAAGGVAGGIAGAASGLHHTEFRGAPRSSSRSSAGAGAGQSARGSAGTYEQAYNARSWHGPEPRSSPGADHWGDPQAEHNAWNAQYDAETARRQQEHSNWQQADAKRERAHHEGQERQRQQQDQSRWDGWFGGGAPAGGGALHDVAPWLKDVKTKADAKSAFRAQARANHPDVGGSTANMQNINNQWEQAQAHPGFSKLGAYYDRGRAAALLQYLRR